MAMVTNHMKDKGGLDQCGSAGNHEKSLSSRVILSVDLTMDFMSLGHGGGGMRADQKC